MYYRNRLAVVNVAMSYVGNKFGEEQVDKLVREETTQRTAYNINESMDIVI